MSTQEAIAFAELLKGGARPDVAIFYDGAKDVYATLDNRRAGLTEGELSREREFRFLSRSRAIRRIRGDAHGSADEHRSTREVDLVASRIW